MPDELKSVNVRLFQRDIDKLKKRASTFKRGSYQTGIRDLLHSALDAADQPALKLFKFVHPDKHKLVVVLAQTADAARVQVALYQQSKNITTDLTWLMLTDPQEFSLHDPSVVCWVKA